MELWVTVAQPRVEELGVALAGKTFLAKHAKFETAYQAKRDRAKRTHSDTGHS